MKFRVSRLPFFFSIFLFALFLYKFYEGRIYLFLLKLSRGGLFTNYLLLLVTFLFTVGENIIATIKIRNNYCAIQSFISLILRYQYWTFLVKLSLFILFASFLVSVLFPIGTGLKSKFRQYSLSSIQEGLKFESMVAKNNT